MSEDWKGQPSIPQWAWDEATRIYGEIGYTVGHKEPVSSVVRTIARSLAQARSQAFEQAPERNAE